MSSGFDDSRTADFDLRENSFRKSFSACFRESIVPFISRNCAETSDSLSCIRRYSTARTDTATTKAVPVRNRQTDAATATTGIRMLTDLVRPWGTSRMVTGVRIRFRKIRARFIATSFKARGTLLAHPTEVQECLLPSPDGGTADTVGLGGKLQQAFPKGLQIRP